MPVASAKKIIELSRATNPKMAIINAFGDLSDERVLYDLVLIGTYVQPEKFKSGLIKPESLLREDEYQGVIGLIIKMGPEAEEQAKETNGPIVGDWVVSSTKDGWAMTIKDTPCRLVAYDRLRMRISDPKVIYNA